MLVQSQSRAIATIEHLHRYRKVSTLSLRFSLKSMVSEKYICASNTSSPGSWSTRCTQCFGPSANLRSFSIRPDIALSILTAERLRLGSEFRVHARKHQKHRFQSCCWCSCGTSDLSCNFLSFLSSCVTVMLVSFLTESPVFL